MRRLMLAGTIAFLSFILCASPADSQSLPPQLHAAAPSGTATISPGQKFILQLETAIHTHTTRKGDQIEFQIAGDVYVENQVVILAGSRVRAIVAKSKRAGRLAGRAEVQLRLEEVLLADGNKYPMRATIIRVGVAPVDAKDGQPKIKGDAGPGGSVGTVASAGAQGAIVGVLVGGLKGAMYGGAASAAISLAGMLFRRGPDLDLPRDTMFEARFDQPLAVPLSVVQRNDIVRATEQVAHTEQVAQNEELVPQLEEASGDVPNMKTRPTLRRSGRVDQPTVQAVPDSMPPAENPAIPVPAETPPIIDPVSSPETKPQPTAPPTHDVPAAPPATVAMDARPGEPGGFKLSVSVKMVLLDAVVRDRAGRMIDDLTREDFRVYEDGVEQQIRSFSRDSLPLAVALVIDRSGSVAPYINELRRIANDALQHLKRGDKVALFSFANTVERIEDLTTDRQQIASGITRIRAGGSTDIIDALFDATNYLAKAAPDYRRAVILISDNQATVRPHASEGETIRMAMETETVIYSLKTSGEAAPLTMRLPNILMGTGSVHKVAQETGGEVIDVANAGMLDAALTGVISRLRSRYALGYYPSNQVRGGAFHSIEVRLVNRLGRPGSNYFMHARRGYYATSEQSAARTTP